MEEWEQVLNNNESSNNKASNGVVVSSGTSSLVLGIIGLLFCGLILGPIAIVLASKNTDPRTAGNATAGKILGIIAIIISILTILWVVYALSVAAGGVNNIY